MQRFETLEPRRLFSGITMITHGQGGGGDDEAEEIAQLIGEQAGGAAHYVMQVEPRVIIGAEVTSFTKDFDSPAIDEVASGEMIVRLDWSEASTSPTTVIADAAAEYMLENGLVEQEIHLAGPSRGAS